MSKKMNQSSQRIEAVMNWRDIPVGKSTSQEWKEWRSLGNTRNKRKKTIKRD